MRSAESANYRAPWMTRRASDPLAFGPASPSRRRTHGVRFSREFIAFTLEFAQHVERIEGIPLDEALLRFTHLYLSFGLPRDFDRLNPVWRAFVAGLTSPRDLVEWTYTFYLQQQTRVRAGAVPIDPAFGCFYYAIWPHNRVRLHFQARRDARPQCTEPGAPPRSGSPSWPPCSTHLQRSSCTPSATVVGGSWLYNIEAYRPAVSARLRSRRLTVGADEDQFMAQWRQFLDRHGDTLCKPSDRGSYPGPGSPDSAYGRRLLSASAL